MWRGGRGGSPLRSLFRSVGVKGRVGAGSGGAGSVAGDGGVDDGGPEIDAAGERLGVLEALLAEPHGDVERARAVVAEDDDGLIGV